MQFSTNEVTLVALSAVTVGIVQVIKRLDSSNKYRNWLPLVSLVVGSTISILSGYTVLQGLMVGLSASGLYDVGKSAVRK